MGENNVVENSFIVVMLIKVGFILFILYLIEVFVGLFLIMVVFGNMNKLEYSLLI